MMDIFISNILPVLASIISALLVWVLRRVADKLGVQASVERDMLVRMAARTAVRGAEEWAARAFKIKGTKPDGAEKARWVVDRLKQQYPKMPDNELVALIDEELAAAPNMGATGRPVGSEWEQYEKGQSKD